ncbi:MAG: hypothetical protein QM765_53165 [Myxococcales bacterium]
MPELLSTSSFERGPSGRGVEGGGEQRDLAGELLAGQCVDRDLDREALLDLGERRRVDRGLELERPHVLDGADGALRSHVGAQVHRAPGDGAGDGRDDGGVGQALLGEAQGRLGLCELGLGQAQADLDLVDLGLRGGAVLEEGEGAVVVELGAVDVDLGQRDRRLAGLGLPADLLVLDHREDLAGLDLVADLRGQELDASPDLGEDVDLVARADGARERDLVGEVRPDHPVGLHQRHLLEDLLRLGGLLIRLLQAQADHPQDRQHDHNPENLRLHRCLLRRCSSFFAMHWRRPARRRED